MGASGGEKTSRLQDPVDFLNERGYVDNMLDDIVSKNYIRRVIRQRNSPIGYNEILSGSWVC